MRLDIATATLSFLLLCQAASAELRALCYGEPGVNLPIRYFFIQLQNGNRRNLTGAVPGIRLELQKTEDKQCRPTARLINRGDGSYIARVRVMGSCGKKLDVSVLSEKGERLCEMQLSNADGSSLLQEECLCPEQVPPVREWIDQAKCEHEPQLESDLERFPTIDFAAVHAEVMKRHGQPAHSRTYSVCHYAIRENKLYRKCYGEYVGFAAFSDDILLSVMRKMRLPDTQFFMNLGDYPLSYPGRGGGSMVIPMISWCGSQDSADIILPTYSLTNTLLRGELFEPIHNPSYNEPVPWAQKKDLAFFRGRDSNQLRLSLAKLSDEQPDLLDAGITRYFFFEKDKHSAVRDSVRQSDFFKHRYIISVDGTVAAYRLPYLLAGDSVVLKSDSKYYEHFYSKLEPGLHYVPFNEENAKEVLERVRTMDFTQNLLHMKQFAIDHLQPLNIYCYYAKFFEAYSSRVQQGEISIDGLEDIPQQGREDCDCGRSRKKEERTKQELPYSPSAS